MEKTRKGQIHENKIVDVKAKAEMDAEERENTEAWAKGEAKVSKPVEVGEIEVETLSQN